jgi:putative ubiquitin-RnfH superfamily antitoxin RatB of RatAB toxin-antitoxin module
MQVAVAYSDVGQQLGLNIEVPDETGVKEAIKRSGVLKQFL